LFSKIITTERLVLRPYEEGDISFWNKWNLDPEVQRFMPELKNEAMSDAAQRLFLQECKNNPEDIYWTIVWGKGNEPVGTITLFEINKHHGIAELGIVIGEKDYWGKGIAKEAIQAVLVFAVSDLGLRRIVAEYEEGNIALEKALLSCGFQQECVCKESRIKNGKPINTIRFIFLQDRKN
jgi:ribosomal-protein-alanine N-acetyltransferase